MQNLRRLLPSAGNLVIFECAGRLLSFTAAAAELGMTQAAVSYAIRNLETELAVSLFTRAHRRVELTAAGQRFHVDVTLGKGAIMPDAILGKLAEVAARHQLLPVPPQAGRQISLKSKKS